MGREDVVGSEWQDSKRREMVVGVVLWFLGILCVVVCGSYGGGGGVVLVGWWL